MASSTVPHEQPLGTLTPEQEEQASRRAACVAGLRDLAMCLESHPAVPVPNWVTAGACSYGEMTGSEFAEAVAAMRAMAPTVVGPRDGIPDDVSAVAKFGPVEMLITIPARLVAEQRVVPRAEWVVPAALSGSEAEGNWTAEQLGLNGRVAA